MKQLAIKLARFIFRAWAVVMVLGAVVGLFSGEFVMAISFAAGALLAWIVTAKGKEKVDPENEVDRFPDARKNAKNIKVSCSLHITYEDGEGNVTKRDIHIFSYDPKSRYIQARDSIANANRTFRIDRIQEAIDLESGELVENYDLPSWILKQHS